MLNELFEDWKNKIFKAIYWLEGEEHYFIDRIVEEAPNLIIPKNLQDFNLTFLHGRNCQWKDVVLACKRYPINIDYQLVIVKDAHLIDSETDSLEKYLKNPNNLSICLIACKKKPDGKSRLYKIIKENVVILHFKKLYENQVKDWIKTWSNKNDFPIDPKAIEILYNYNGNDLTTIYNELEKLKLNLLPKQKIVVDDIVSFLGEHREYNAFEYINALLTKDKVKLFNIVNYFQHNQKNNFLNTLLINLYNSFCKLLILDQFKNISDSILAEKMSISPYFLKEYKMGYKNFLPVSNIQHNIILLLSFNLKLVGVKPVGASEGELLKELTIKLMNANN